MSCYTYYTDSHLLAHVAEAHDLHTTESMRCLYLIGVAMRLLQGLEATSCSLDLVVHLYAAAPVLRPLLLSPVGAPILSELDTFQRNVRACLESMQQSAPLANASIGSQSPENGSEKYMELLTRAAAASKQLVHALRAPGKGD